MAGVRDAQDPQNMHLYIKIQVQEVTPHPVPFRIPSKNSGKSLWISDSTTVIIQLTLPPIIFLGVQYYSLPNLITVFS